MTAPVEELSVWQLSARTVWSASHSPGTSYPSFMKTVKITLTCWVNIAVPGYLIEQCACGNAVLERERENNERDDCVCIRERTEEKVGEYTP